MSKVSWGVLGVAKIATTKVIPAMQRSEVTSVTAIASRDLSKAQAAATALGIPRVYGSYRGDARRSRDRVHLQSAAEPSARPVVDPRGRSGQTCTV